MGASRIYSQKQNSYEGFQIWDNSTGQLTNLDYDEYSGMLKSKNENALENTAKELAPKYLGNKDNESLMTKFKSIQGMSNKSVKSKTNNSEKNYGNIVDKIRLGALNYLLELLFGNDKLLSNNNCSNEINIYDNISEANDISLMENEETIGGNYTSFYEYYEKETTTFSTKGTVVTEDGKSIDFNIDIEMSRSFYEKSYESIDFGAARFKDPLVINLDCDAAEVTDQKFYFDLDADGHDEYISTLSSTSGYLALDKNKDGLVNDGSELFGVESGNGFDDLASYDLDGNGWIDQADEIFDKLLIWSMDEDGNSNLCALGKAGVGAIYLGNKETEFSINDSKNVNNALIRKTGMFLYENGGVGTIQQMDLSV